MWEVGRLGGWEPALASSAYLVTNTTAAINVSATSSGPWTLDPPQRRHDLPLSHRVPGLILPWYPLCLYGWVGVIYMV